ncbi:MAG: CocE/NonD family hydrolase [Planctomycetota bacterium]
MTRRHHLLLAVLLLWTTVLLPASSAQTPAPPLEQHIREHYVKQEHMIPMRDGVRLYTAVYLPRDTSVKWPVLIKRTPYASGPYGPDKFPASLGPSEHFARAGYIFVNQDVRGRFLSEGTFEQVRPHLTVKTSPQHIDESTDAWDTIDWLVKNIPGHNGKVGMAGISYPGFYASAGMIDAHPALIAVSPQAPVGDWYFDDFLHHGAFFLAHAFRWLNSNAQERPRPTTERAAPNALPSLDGYQMFLEAGTIAEINRRWLKDSVPFWNEMMAHPNRDEFWQKRAILPHLKNTAPAVMVVTGWFDAEDLYGSFKTYQSVERLNPHVNNVLVVGPWIHGGWASTRGDRLGPVSFDSPTAEYYRAEIEFPFFEKYLRGDDHPAPAEATVFETGSNTWRTFDKWPPQNVTAARLKLLPHGRLAAETLAGKPLSVTTTATESAPSATPDSGYDEYISDPAHPVPYTEVITNRMTVEYMVEDQRFAARRPDVLLYQTEPLRDDLTMAGPLMAEFHVATTGTDADFIVKLIDVFPDGTDPALQPGFQMMVRSEVLRGRFRNSYEHPEAFVPGEPAKIRLELLDVLHRFRRGHRIMLQIQSTWFPLVDRNPQTFVPNIYFAKPEDFRKASHRLYRSSELPAAVTFGLLP